MPHAHDTRRRAGCGAFKHSGGGASEVQRGGDLGVAIGSIFDSQGPAVRSCRYVPYLEVLDAVESSWNRQPSAADDIVQSKPEALVAKVTEMLSVSAR
jgi:hypothetical protein